MDTEKETAKARRAWDRFAARYDRSMGWFEHRLFPGAREWVCSRARGQVLEVAVGTGLNLPFYPGGVRLTGVDLSPRMVGLAQRRAAELGREVELKVADASALPFLDNSFDTVVCTLGLCTIPDERAAIDQMRRVLRPGGRLLLLDHVGSTWPPIWWAQWLLEQITARTTSEYQTRRPLPLVHDSGLIIEESERSKAGIVERVAAVKPAEMP